MPKILTPEARGRFVEDGVLFPLEALSAAEAQSLRARYESQADQLKGRNNQKPHLLFPWIDELIRHPRILDAVEDVLGPNLLCWSSQFFSKPANDPAYVSWHQDGTYQSASAADPAAASFLNRELARWLAFDAG